jgi:ribonuclease BN (tRNA processing enzyme)
MIRLTCVGTGTAAPSPSRVQSAHLVETGDVRLLLDCGSGVAFRLANIGIDWSGITHVALTHFHPDHMLDLPTLLFAWRWGQLPPREAPLEILGPPGTQGLLERLAAATGDDMLSLGYPVMVRELEPGAEATIGTEILLRSRKVPHTAESVAYSVERGGRRIVYTGDTGHDRALGEWAAGCDILLAECSLPDELAIATHLTPRRCGELAAIAAPALLALTHFYPPVEATDIAGQVAERFEGPVSLAHDGWTRLIEDR